MDCITSLLSLTPSTEHQKLNLPPALPSLLITTPTSQAVIVLPAVAGATPSITDAPSLCNNNATLDNISETSDSPAIGNCGITVTSRGLTGVMNNISSGHPPPLPSPLLPLPNTHSRTSISGSGFPANTSLSHLLLVRSDGEEELVWRGPIIHLQPTAAVTIALASLKVSSWHISAGWS